MLPLYETVYGNPSAIHGAGQEAKKALEAARRKVAASIGAKPSEILFTSGGTESDNWAIKSVFEAVEASYREGKPSRSRHMVSSAFEHRAVLRPLEALSAKGWEIDLVAPGKDGLVDPAAVAAVLRPATALVSVMAANNVTGTIQPVKEIAAVAHERGALFHTDAVQAVGHIPMDVRDLNVDLLSLSAHKFHGPKGVGALFAKVPRLPWPLIDGGGQERGGRGGTENVPGAVAMAEALAEMDERMEEDSKELSCLRDRLTARVLAMDGAFLAGDRSRRLPGHACFVFRALDPAANIVAGLDKAGIEASSGSACSASSKEASHVLTAMGITGIEPHHSLRVTLSRWNTASEMDYIADQLETLIPLLRIPVRRGRLSMRRGN